MTPIPDRWRKIAWRIFIAEAIALFAYAVYVDVRHPAPTASGVYTTSGQRFGLSEDQRRAIFLDLVHGENADRVEANKVSETAVWDRNHDDFFHEREARRIAGGAMRARIAPWQAFLILDEGLRAHWPTPPGDDLYIDEPALRRTTTPHERRPLLYATRPAQ